MVPVLFGFRHKTLDYFMRSARFPRSESLNLGLCLSSVEESTELTIVSKKIHGD